MTFITQHTPLHALSSLLTLGLTLLALFSSIDNVNAAPTPQNLALAQKYAPQFRFHKDEKYFPSTVEYFLAGSVSLYDNNGPVAGAPSPLTSANLGDLSNLGSNTYLTVPDIKSNLNGFLTGQNPSTTQTSTYVFIAPKDNGVVDLYYWIYCPYNLGKKVPLLGYVGNHVGDWERITVRTVNGEATSVDYHAHGDTGSGTVPYNQAPKFSPSSPNDPPSPTPSDPNARPVAYVASGSHGMWSSAGTFTYVNAVVFKLQDQTSDGGVYWDTGANNGNSIVAIDYPDTKGYKEGMAWLNYLGDWGNKGATNCWWHVFYNECELVTGPGGPLRDDVLGKAKMASKVASASDDVDATVGGRMRQTMNSPLSNTLASVSEENSSYTIRIMSSNLPDGFVTVDQQCATLNETSTTWDDSTPSYIYTSVLSSIPLSSSSTRSKSIVARSADDIVYTYTLSVPACDSPSTVASYTVGICSTDLSETVSHDEDIAGCTFATQRSIRAFSDEPGVIGVQEVQAVNVNDLDTWQF